MFCQLHVHVPYVVVFSLLVAFVCFLAEILEEIEKLGFEKPSPIQVCL